MGVYDGNKKEILKLRISKEEKEAFLKHCEENGTTMSEVLLDYIRTLTIVKS